MNSQDVSTLIIGAGPAGLAMAGQLAERGIPYTLLEASEYVGFRWRNHYDRLHLHTVKEYSALPHVPFPASSPTYIPLLQVVEYFERYAEHFKIKPLFNQKVVSVVRNEADGRWVVRTETDVFTAERVVVATGYNRIPYIPELPGQRNFRGIIWHSHEYRNGAPFRDENVLVVGMGNTGAELALDLLENNARPFISVRSPVNIVRRETFGRPTQKMAVFLSKFPNWFTDLMSSFSQRLSVGDVSPYGLGSPPHPPSHDNRQGKTPVIDVGTLDQIKAGTIRIVPAIERINAKTVTFTDGRELPFDAIILATGYRPALASFLGNSVAESVTNASGYSKKLWYDTPNLHGLYLLGFTTPALGTLYQLNSDSFRIAEHISQNI